MQQTIVTLDLEGVLVPEIWVAVAANAPAIALEELERKLVGLGNVTRNPFLLRFAVSDYLLTVFPDGRAIIGGTEDISEAKTIYAKYIGA